MSATFGDVESPWKNSNGVWRTHSLFAEKVDGALREKAVYTLKAEDWKGYPSLKRLYIELGDVTGYLLSQQYLGGLEHLEALLDTSWFEEAFSGWRRELEMKLRAEALVALIKMAKDPSHRSSVELQKFLLNKGWVLPEEKAKGGRPKKADIRAAAIQIATINGEVDEDFERVIKGA